MKTAFERNVNGRQGKNCWDTSKEVITSLELLQILKSVFQYRGWCHSERDEILPLSTQARAVVRHAPCSYARGGRLPARLRVWPERLPRFSGPGQPCSLPDRRVWVEEVGTGHWGDTAHVDCLGYAQSPWASLHGEDSPAKQWPSAGGSASASRSIPPQLACVSSLASGHFADRNTSNGLDAPCASQIIPVALLLSLPLVSEFRCQCESACHTVKV